MKSKEELNALKEEVEALNKKLHELTEEELKQVSGGIPEPTTQYVLCNWKFNDLPCNLSIKGNNNDCATCSKNN